MGDRVGAYGVSMGRHDGKRPLGRPRRRGEVILKWIFKKSDGRHGLDSSSSGKGHVAGSCERGNEHWRSIKCGKILDWLRTG